MSYFSGRVHSIIYDNPAQAFYILRMVLDDTGSAESVAVRGNIPGMAIKVGSWFGFDATWSNHKEYGPQLAISRAPVIKTSWDPASAERALCSNGVGERVIQQVRAHFGESEFINALSDQKRLEEAPGVTSFVAMHITQRWQVVQAYFKALGFLNDLGLASGKVKQVWTLFGDDAEKILSTNPWELVRVDGITFQHADEIARRLGLDPTSPLRLKGAVIHACKNQKSFGHLYMTTGQMHAEVQMLVPEVTNDAFAKALAECHRDKILVIDRDTRPGFKGIYDPWAWRMEKESSEFMETRMQTAVFGDEPDYMKRLANVGVATEKASKKKRAKLIRVVETAVDEWGSSAHLALSKAQRQGVINALATPVSIITGLPGTGKTTCMLAVVSILKDMGVPFLLCAPTGIAAKNLGARTGASAYTIHRAFSAKGSSDSKRESTYAGIVGDSDGITNGSEGDEDWGYGAPSNFYPADVVVVDEASMLDQHLIYRLMACTRPDCRMVFVGDAAQLPSVGAGNVLRDLIGSNRFPVVSLTEIFRQKDTSGIVYAAHSIHRGEIPDTTSPDFRLIQIQGEEKVADAIVQLATKLYEKRTNFQILSPRHGGPVGVTALNARLRDLLNPAGRGAQEMKVGDSTIREDDRIMVVKNDYTLKVFNGDIGKVNRIDRKAKEVEVKIFGDGDTLVYIPFKNVGATIRLAYACTVHKAQGLEYDVIVMPVVDGFRHQLQRNLLYTAVTRAKRKVILIGTHSALGVAVLNDTEDLRNTMFRDRLLGWGGSQTPKSA